MEGKVWCGKLWQRVTLALHVPSYAHIDFSWKKSFEAQRRRGLLRLGMAPSTIYLRPNNPLPHFPLTSLKISVIHLGLGTQTKKKRQDIRSDSLNPPFPTLHTTQTVSVSLFPDLSLSTWFLFNLCTVMWLCCQSCGCKPHDHKTSLKAPR